MGDMSYCIHPSYTPRLDYNQWDDTSYKDEWQKAVYQYADMIAKGTNFKSVVDIGCGSGYKLIEYLGHMRTIGVELEPNYSFCKSTYPEREWLLSDLHTLPSITPDLVVCSDVIEHFVDPDMLLAYIKKLKPRVCIISTPDRDMMVQRYNVNPDGPPINVHHVREWNMSEFNAYMREHFTVVEHHRAGETQIITCT